MRFLSTTADLKYLAGLTLTLSLSFTEVQATEPPSEPVKTDTAPQAATAISEDLANPVDDSYRAIAQGFEETMRSLDAFFAEEKVYQETTSSLAQLTGSSVIDQSGQVQFSGGVNFKVDLPMTSKRLMLLIESDAKTSIDLDKKPLYSSPQQAAEASKYYSSLQSTINKSEHWDINGSLGVEVSTPLIPFIRARFAYKNTFGEWNYRFSENMFWFNSDGGGHTTSFEFERPLNPDWLYRMTSSGAWKQITNYYDLGQEFAFFQRLGPERNLSYQLAFLGNDQYDLSITEYRVGLRYRQQFYRKWLFAELSPQVSYLASNNFDPARSLTFTLEMLFGSKYL